MRLHIDWTACDGRGLCTELLPELLDRDDWGYPVPREGPEPTIPAGLRAVAGRAVSQCPRLALTLLDERASGQAVPQAPARTARPGRNSGPPSRA